MPSPRPSVDPSDPLARPVWSALHGPHRQFAVNADTDILAVRYQPDVVGFAALSDHTDPRAWAQLAELIGPGQRFALFGLTATRPPADWTVTAEIGVSQLVHPGAAIDDPRQADPGDELVRLTSADVGDMLALIELTQPGPFLPRTVELGGYLGIRRTGQLVAMAGRRMRPPGWVEVSAVCTHPDHRGRGLSRRLLAAVVDEIDQDGQRPFLHVTHGNPAVSLYYRLGFTRRTDAVITVLER